MTQQQEEDDAPREVQSVAGASEPDDVITITPRTAVGKYWPHAGYGNCSWHFLLSLCQDPSGIPFYR